MTIRWRLDTEENWRGGVLTEFAPSSSSSDSKESITWGIEEFRNFWMARERKVAEVEEMCRAFRYHVYQVPISVSFVCRHLMTGVKIE